MLCWHGGGTCRKQLDRTSSAQQRPLQVRGTLLLGTVPFSLVHIACEDMSDCSNGCLSEGFRRSHSSIEDQFSGEEEGQEETEDQDDVRETSPKYPSFLFFLLHERTQKNI
eukprot:6539509-Pyramimonas_sp.AAC.1